MLKKVIIALFILLILTGCNARNLDTLTLDECVNMSIDKNVALYNVNNIGYRYYLPRGFILEEDRESIQIIKSKGVDYYLNVDLISYYNKIEISRNSVDDVYQFISFGSSESPGFLEIVQNNDYFLVKMVYNYAIIETRVKESDLKSSVINMSYILSSIKYNDIVINNKFGEDTLVFNESTYKIFGPIKNEEVKNYAYYLEQYDKYTGTIENKVKDPDVIE